jgi:hypothetical protein
MIFILEIESNKMELSGKLCSLIVMRWLLENYMKKMSQVSGGQISLLSWKKLVFVMRISIGLSTFFWMKSWDLLK